MSFFDRLEAKRDLIDRVSKLYSANRVLDTGSEQRIAMV